MEESTTYQPATRFPIYVHAGIHDEGLRESSHGRSNVTHRSRRVHRIRIEVHNLRHDETREREGISENHLTFALLLGNGQSVRFDMTPNADTHIGMMEVQDRKDIVSRKTVRLTDINAVGCQNSFDPDETPSRRGRGRSVDCFLQFLLSHQMSRYRFMYVDSQAVGCRYWVQTVMEAFQHSGYLRGDADFSRGIEGGEPLCNLLNCQWDVKDDLGHPILMAPGIFLENRGASAAGIAQIAARLELSSLDALLTLANVLDCRVEHGDLSNRVVRWQLCSAESHIELLQELATASNLENFEGSVGEDLSQAPSEMINLLRLYLTERYEIAASALVQGLSQRFDGSVLDHTQPDLFVHMLTAVCSMAGAANDQG